MLTNIASLGQEYNVTDIKTGKIVKTIQLITSDEILEATIGEYSGDFSDINEYLEKCVSMLEGFSQIKPYSVMWYASKKENVILRELIDLAMQDGYNKIILEYIEENEK